MKSDHQPIPVILSNRKTVLDNTLTQNLDAT